MTALTSGMSAGTAKTPQAVEGEARQPGPEGETPKPLFSKDSPMTEQRARDVPGAYRVGHSKPNGHPADGMTAQVCIGGGAFMTIPNPQSYESGGIVWTLTWGNHEAVRLTAGSLITSYDYLLSGAISTKEAISRLRMLRRARAALQSSEADNG